MPNELVADELKDWRQGDVILGAFNLPLLDVGDDGLAVFSEETDGALILTQTCDIVRSYERKPFLHIAALVTVGEADFYRIKKGQEVRYLYVPALADRQIVADLDLVATVDKKVASGRERLVGCSSDEERRALAGTIARHRERFAFPDLFNAAVKPLRRWVEGGHGKASDKGRFIDAIIEIRATADDWDNPSEVEFVCIIPADTTAALREAWAAFIPQLEQKAASDWCKSCIVRLSTYREMSADEYLKSIRLDFDGLSDA